MMVLRLNAGFLDARDFLTIRQFSWYLREELMRFEQDQEEGDHLYRSSMDLRETMVPYYPELHDEKKIHRQILLW